MHHYLSILRGDMECFEKQKCRGLKQQSLQRYFS